MFIIKEVAMGNVIVDNNAPMLGELANEELLAEASQARADKIFKPDNNNVVYEEEEEATVTNS